ncbi:hypothetical protein [Desulfurobacterium indicum]|nr:hypothetical protein [Desulfurobacterium indicum]
MITNFFPSFDGNNILEPAYKNGEFIYKINGKYISEEQFRLYFVDADFKTSIDPLTITAKEKQLYEFEYILPKPKKEFLKDVENLEFQGQLYWIGLIKIEDKKKGEFLKNNPKIFVGKIFVGGDTRYGYGLLKIIECKEAKEELKNWHLNDEGKFEYDDKTPLRNFFEFKSNIKFKGEIKLIPELEFTNRDPRVKDAKFYITPGSILEPENNENNNLDNLTLKLVLKKGKFILET